MAVLSSHLVKRPARAWPFGRRAFTAWFANGHAEGPVTRHSRSGRHRAFRWMPRTGLPSRTSLKNHLPVEQTNRLFRTATRSEEWKSWFEPPATVTSQRLSRQLRAAGSQPRQTICPHSPFLRRALRSREVPAAPSPRFWSWVRKERRRARRRLPGFRSSMMMKKCTCF